MYGIIYKINNDVNNFVYIGQTISSLKHRWSEHKQEAINLVHYNKLYIAMNTIGIEYFTVELLEEYIDITPEDLDIREQYWINFYNSFYNGYNSTKGGKIGYRNINPILCYTLSGKLYKQYDTVGEAASDLNISYDSIILCLNSSKQDSCGGFQWKYKDSDKIIQDYSYDLNFNAKKCYFIQYDLHGNYINHFNSCKAASEITGCQESGIIRCIQNKINYCNEYIWRRGFFGEDIPKIINIDKIITNTNKGKSRKVIYINKDNEKIVYNSLSEASRMTGYSRHKITYNCNIYPNSTLENGRFTYAENEGLYQIST